MNDKLLCSGAGSHPVGCDLGYGGRFYRRGAYRSGVVDDTVNGAVAVAVAAVGEGQGDGVGNIIKLGVGVLVESLVVNFVILGTRLERGRPAHGDLDRLTLHYVGHFELHQAVGKLNICRFIILYNLLVGVRYRFDCGELGTA